MTTATAQEYLSSLLAGRPALPATPVARFDAMRAAAVDRVGVLTVPTVRDEEWRFTDISPLTRQNFQPVGVPTRLDETALAGFHLDEAATRLVFIDGIYAPELSTPTGKTGFRVANLGNPTVALEAAVEGNLGRHGRFDDDVFASLNTAFLRDGALVVVPRETVIADPVHLLFVAKEPGAASYPRCLVVAETGSKVTFVEDFVSLQNDAYFTDAVTEVALAERAEVDHVRVQREGGEAFHIASCAVSLARDSRYRSVSVALGARISRYGLAVRQSGPGARCEVDGLALIGGRQLADTHTSIDHGEPDGVSRQRHKCIVDGAAHAVFNGKIVVRPGAQRTDSSQSSRNLLLTGRAQVDTKPQLEIFADDVKCAHGATVGREDADALFYLVSRGLSAAAARSLLTYAFAAEIIERVPVGSLRRRLETYALGRTERRP